MSKIGGVLFGIFGLAGALCAAEYSDASANGILTFKPALPIPPFRGVMVANWKKAKSTVIDNRAALKAGATISTVAFANGDLLGKGKRTLPAIPADVAAAWPDPNRIVFPPAGH